jgi:ABC-2 type transport system ATP-binding protein
LRVIVGLLDPDEGNVRIFGQPATSESSALRALIGYMPQQYSLYGDLTVDENLRFYSQMFGLSRSTFYSRKERLLKLTRLDRFGARRADALSGGMYKKLALACALLPRPKVLVLDEPTNGVDPVSRREFWDLLSNFVSEGMGVLVSTPYMDEASRCDRVALMHQGRIFDQGSPLELLRAFDGHALRVDAQDREKAATALENHPQVVALSPSGGALRVVVTAAGLDDVQALIESLHASSQPLRPSFEDLFLTRLHPLHPGEKPKENVA